MSSKLGGPLTTYSGYTQPKPPATPAIALNFEILNFLADIDTDSVTITLVDGMIALAWDPPSPPPMMPPADMPTMPMPMSPSGLHNSTTLNVPGFHTQYGFDLNIEIAKSSGTTTWTVTATNVDTGITPDFTTIGNVIATMILGGLIANMASGNTLPFSGP